MIGARVIKTSLAVAISILLARSYDLDTPHFAGIIAVLAVQPSIYRTFRHGIQQTISAVLGASLGAFALYAVGDSFFVMGIVALLLMTLHVKIRWTNSLLVAVVIAINTMGTTHLSFAESALNQMALVLIGMGIGTLINLLHKPVHEVRARVLLVQSEGMLRALLHYMHLDLQENRVTPYASVMKEQIEHVRGFIEKGKEISGLISEDQRFRIFPHKNTFTIFHSFEIMVERIRDMSKELQQIDLTDQQIGFLKKAVRVAACVQERAVNAKISHANLVKRVLEQRRITMWIPQKVSADFASRLAFYNFYGYLLEYVREISSEQVSQHDMLPTFERKIHFPTYSKAINHEMFVSTATHTRQ
ncbi:FUSC family protein [Effusibacillus consociatus]|uniref:Aromatic acid exporter family protein n=1 Tax=Effusibacillus consociatus TaxID=1117041 RepID=A0ABV9Q364_9BACL